MEHNYDFRKRLNEVHKKGIKNDAIWKRISGCVIDEQWEIICPHDAGVVLKNAAIDLQEYFLISMDLRIPIRTEERSSLRPKSKRIQLDTAVLQYDEPMAFALEVGCGIVILGATERGTAQGCYYLEDLMNQNRGPVVEMGRVERRPLFSVRMIHSGYGMDRFPDEHLRAIAHAGIDAILVFVRDWNQTTYGECDFNDLIHRADAFGIRVYAYSYYKNWKHPEDADAREFYERSYGRLFEKNPGFAGLVMVGESMEFPSKDPHVVCCPYDEKTPENNPEGKLSPGWYPCCDYPEFISLIRDVVRDKKPDADIVFWTYNWGCIEEEARARLLRALPTDITVQATFEMFEEFQISDTVQERCVDYTISFAGPGKYFESEARICAERGIRLYTMCNTGGLTWDVGVIPYEPTPHQWQKRHAALLNAREQYGLSGLMESHHYGFWPSFISELAKNAYWEPAIPAAQMLERLVQRDFGEENKDVVMHALQRYSEGITHYVPTEEDQYGPYRIGPAYPLLFLKEADLPADPSAWFGGRICMTMYRYNLNHLDKLQYEISCADAMRQCFHQGNELLKQLKECVDGYERDQLMHLLTLGQFIERSAMTCRNVKQWYILKWKLLEKIPSCTVWDQDSFLNATEGKVLTPQEREELFEEMQTLAQDEIQNARDTILLVTYDSRLGWEPSMEYVCDRSHLEWKIQKTEDAIYEMKEWLMNR